MAVRYTDGAKTLIGAVLIGAVALFAFIVFILFRSESQGTNPVIQPEKNEFTCVRGDYIGYANSNDIGTRMEELAQKKYELYCLEKSGVRQWSIYAR